jgi:protein-tyrosine phosphatase
MTRNRVLDLQGACNFRDFGGYTTTDGRTVRWGRLYRSGVLARLEPRAIEQVRALGIRAVCDLRRSDERALHPNPTFGPDVRQFEWDTTEEVSPIRDRQFAESSTAAAAHAAMLRMYERIPFIIQPRLSGVFEALVTAGEGAVIVHCSAGKDRTGVAAALVLEALGVPRAAVIEDYVLTNTSVDLRAQLLARQGTGVGMAATAEPMLALAPAALDAVLAAHPGYLQASLAAIEARHGSIAGYLRDELKVTAVSLTRLQDSLLD